MIEKLDRIVYTIIHMPNYSESKKKSLIVKLVHSPTLKGGKALEQVDVEAIFDTCVSIITTEENDGMAQLAVFAFNNWAGQYKNYLKEYLTPEKLTNILATQVNVVIVIAWLKETLCHLSEDADALCSIAPILEGLLQNKLRECGSNSAFIAKLADLYAVCPALLPQPHTRLTFTVTLMNCVASFPTPTNTEVCGHMKSVATLINTLWNGLRLEDILSSLHAMYAIISNTEGGPEVCPAMAHLLSLVPTVVVEALAPRIVADPNTTDAALTATLTRLTAWLVLWPLAHVTLGLWVRTLVRLLYQNGRTSVPMKVTLDRVPKLLNAMQIPIVRNGIVSVISTLLLSLQSCPIAFHKIISPLLEVFGKLEREHSDSARATLSQLSTLIYTLMVLHPGYPQTYQPLMDILVKYKPPLDKDIQELIQQHAWAAGEGRRNLPGQVGVGVVLEVTPSYQQRNLSQKAGLRNLGNTCYMNSVIQALYMTDSFRHQILHAVPRSNQQLLVKLQQLFSLLSFTKRSYVAPRLFHDKSRPPWFSPGMQQDCSEYLRHLMITLHEEERAGQRLPEYQERVIIESETASLASDLQPLPYDSASEDFGDIEHVKADSCADDHSSCDKIGCNSQKEFHKVLQSASSVDRDVEMECLETLRRSSKKRACIDHLEGRDVRNDHHMDVGCETECKGTKIMPEKGKVASQKDINTSGEVSDSVMWVEEDNEEMDTEVESSENESQALLNFPKSSNFNVKNTISHEGAAKPSVKSTKGDMTSDMDNSSDSGISGDLAEDLELRSPNANSPSPKESFVPSRGLTVEEVAIEDLNNEESENDYFVSLVHKVFGGKLATCIKCLQCKTESIHKDVFTDIHLAFQDTDRYNATTAIKRNPERICKQKYKDNPADLRIEDMITSYLTSEMLTGENQYECDRCGCKQDAERSIQILEPPEHLILTQLRFYYDTLKGQRQKVFTNVEFGEELLLPVRYSSQGILPDNFDLSQSKVAVQGFLSASDTSDGNLGISPNDKSDNMSVSSESTCALNRSGSDQTRINDVDGSKYQNSGSEERNTSHILSSTNASSSSVLPLGCSALGENYVQSDSKVPCNLNDSLNSSCGSSITSNSSCRNTAKSERENSAHKVSQDMDAQPSCSYASAMENMPKRASDPFSHSSGEGSACMTPRERCEAEQEDIVYARYALYGVVVHSGFSSEGGHYYCFARSSSIASLPESAKERYEALGGWYNFNDEKVTDTSFSAINDLTRTFSRDTAYLLFYKKLSDHITPDVPLVEDFKGLRLDLREVVENDNLQYNSEQDREFQRRRCQATGNSNFPHGSDHDDTPPPGGCGGGPGGGGFNTPSRVVF